MLKVCCFSKGTFFFKNLRCILSNIQSNFIYFTNIFIINIPYQCGILQYTSTTLWLPLLILFSFSANPAYHELLLTVLWYGVVHTSALVRCTAARMFEVCKWMLLLPHIIFSLEQGEGNYFFKMALHILLYIDVYFMVLNSV